MDAEFDKSLLRVHINYNNFPAKLWRLINNPQNDSVFWSPNGESVIVDQQRFEDELLSPVKQDAKLFKTTNFTSFIRQLNLYGFRKVYDRSFKDRRRNLHHFHNPVFKQGRPELLVHMKRLTISNKAKMEAGEEVTCRPPRRDHQQSQHNTTDAKRGFADTNQHFGSVSHQQMGSDRSPIPPHSWIIPYSDVPPFYSNKGIPVSVIRLNPYNTPYRIQSGPGALFPQEPKYIPHQLSYPPGFYSPVCQCCTAGFIEADRAGADQTALPYSHYAYYPQNYSQSHHHNSIQTANWPAHVTPESQRGDVNLDRVFQMVDEFQGLPNVHVVRVSTPVNGQHTSSPSLCTLPAASKPDPDSPQSSRIDTAASIPVRDERPSAMACSVGAQYIKLESEGHDAGASQLKEDDSASLEASEKVKRRWYCLSWSLSVCCFTVPKNTVSQTIKPT
ncbi:heat shock factor protein 5-like isoform X3 [Sinocyclocheilus grahami]|uniref:heat shock factor protein 5-like isoform X3 n=1 Tax=Sinocyclocheilus grahami TaxID=75366 RepID=UPI0007ACAA9B|nr:PREDICTED: heat shock factor protein 5-like isoform X3 [Sinocyclocheilus grahami]